MTKNASTKPAKVESVPRKLQGKRIAFTGKFGPSEEGVYGEIIQMEGGEIAADVTEQLDYLVVGRARGRTNAEKRAENLNQKQGASIQILDENAFRQLFALTCDEAMALLRGGEEGVARWNRLWELCSGYGRGMPSIDLRGIDLRGVDFHHANLQSAILDDTDLRDANLSHVYLGELKNVKLDRARLKSARFSRAHDCIFHKADLSDAHINPADFKSCDFTEAQLQRVSGHYTQAAEVIFRKADLSRAILVESKFQRADFAQANLSEAWLNKCDFTGAVLKSANLRKAELTDAKLVNADLSGADLREAILVGVDLAGANIEGANFTGANITGAKIAGLSAAEAIGLNLSAASAGGKIGPNILELERIAKQSGRLEAFAVIDMKDHPAELRLICHSNGRWISTYTGAPNMGHHGHATSFSAAMIDLARRWTNGTLRLASITAKSNKGPLGGKQLRRLAASAWCEACGVPVQSEAEIEEQLQAAKADQDDLRAKMLEELRGGPAGIKQWNARLGGIVPMHCLSLDPRKKVGHFHRVDLSNLNLSGVDLSGLDFQGAVFDGSTLVKAILGRGDFRKVHFSNARLDNAACGIAKFSGADFTAASLYQANLRVCTFVRAVFDGADLREADLGYADLRGADLSNANLSGTKFEHTKYNEETRLPPGFTPSTGMDWKGHGPAPGTAPAAPVLPFGGGIDFATLMERLPQTVSGASLSKALQMLKADRFQLYAEVKDNFLVGVVKSQSDPDLVYSCRLAADGAFGCCTQNLRACGGLHGRLCKHLLVLLVGLTKAGQLEPALAEQWALASRSQRPTLDKDAMSETFLRYKGAEAGEIDWRPTETIPEDYYAL